MLLPKNFCLLLNIFSSKKSFCPPSFCFTSKKNRKNEGGEWNTKGKQQFDEKTQKVEISQLICLPLKIEKQYSDQNINIPFQKLKFWPGLIKLLKCTKLKKFGDFLETQIHHNSNLDYCLFLGTCTSFNLKVFLP